MLSMLVGLVSSSTSSSWADCVTRLTSGQDCTLAAGVHEVDAAARVIGSPGLKLIGEAGAIVDGTRALSGLAWQPCSAVPEFAARCADGVETAVVDGPVQQLFAAASGSSVRGALCWNLSGAGAGCRQARLRRAHFQ